MNHIYTSNKVHAHANTLSYDLNTPFHIPSDTYANTISRTPFNVLSHTLSLSHPLSHPLSPSLTPSFFIAPPPLFLLSHIYTRDLLFYTSSYWILTHPLTPFNTLSHTPYHTSSRPLSHPLSLSYPLSFHRYTRDPLDYTSSYWVLVLLESMGVITSTATAASLVRQHYIAQLESQVG